MDRLLLSMVGSICLLRLGWCSLLLGCHELAVALGYSSRLRRIR